jgi:hypothetical protein
MEEQKTISNAEKRWLVRELEAGRITIGEAKERLIAISKDPYALLLSWRKRYASDIPLTLPIMTEKEKAKLEAAHKRMRELEKQLAGAAAGVVSGAASGLIVGKYENHSGNQLWNDVWIGAATGLVTGVVDKGLELDGIESDVVKESLKGGAKGLAGGFTHGIISGASKGYALKDDFKLGLTEGIIGAGFGLAAGAAEGALKSQEPEFLKTSFNRLRINIGFYGAARAALANGISWSQIINATALDSNISGKILGSFLENSEDNAYGDKTSPYRNLNHFIWGGVFDNNQ